MARFELAAPRPPDVYSNLAELHPEVNKVIQSYIFFDYYPILDVIYNYIIIPAQTVTFVPSSKRIRLPVILFFLYESYKRGWVVLIVI